MFLGFYLFIHERHTERERQRQKQAPCKEPNAGLDLRILGSRLEPKADAQPLSHPGVPVFLSLSISLSFLRSIVIEVIYIKKLMKMFKHAQSKQ